MLPRLPFKSELIAFAFLGLLLFGNNVRALHSCFCIKRDSYFFFPFFLSLSFTAPQENNVIGTYLTDAPTASFAQQIVPVLGVFSSAFAGLESFPTLRSMDSTFKLFGLALSTIGAVVLVISGHKHVDNSTQNLRSIGELCLLLNATSTALYFTFQSMLTFASPKRQRHAGNLRGLERGVLRRWARAPLLTAAYTYFFSCVFSSLSLLIRFGISNFNTDIFYVSFNGWISILFAALVASTFCYAILTWVNKLLRPGVTTGTIPVQAVASTLLSSWILKIPVTLSVRSAMPDFQVNFFTS
jgi:drug/metabolite transporter (DMT)-like permease